VGERAVGEHRAADQVKRADRRADGGNGDGAVVDRAAVNRQRAGAVDRDLAAGVVERAARHDGERAAGQYLNEAVIVDRLGGELVGGAADVDGAVVGERAVGEHRAADQVKRADRRADGGNGDGAVVDRAAVNRQGAGAVDRDLAAGVVERAARHDGERAAGQYLNEAVIVDRLGGELVGGAADVDGAVVGERAVGEHRAADQVKRADRRADGGNGDGAVVDRAAVSPQLAGAVDRDLAAGVV